MLLRKRRGSRAFEIDGSVFDEGGVMLEIQDHRANPEQSYAGIQEEEKLKGAIRRMSPQLREVIELRQGSELSVNEIAQSLCISVPAAKSRLLGQEVDFVSTCSESRRR
jgi:RNA polymerase sigma-70 factor (ECF subfamily)